MCCDGYYYGLPPATPDLGRGPWQGNPLSQTTVNPLDLLLAQPSHGPTQPYGISHNIVFTDYNSVGYPAVENTSQGIPLCYPPVGLSQSMGHTSGQVINDVPAGHSTEHLTPVGRMSRGQSIRCQWMSEDRLICGQTVAERTVPKHLAEHGIQSMHRDRIVQCRWNGCWMPIKRQSITRHYREVHLGVKRKSHKHHKHAFPSDDLCH